MNKEDEKIENTFMLNGSNGSDNCQFRLSFLQNAINNAESKINHLDGMRQKNFNYALVIFAGLYGIGSQFTEKLNFSPKLLSTLILVMMLMFSLIDRRLHKLSHGWRETCWLRVKTITMIINNPEIEIEYPKYQYKGQNRAERFSLQPLIFYLLCLGGAFSYFIF